MFRRPTLLAAAAFLAVAPASAQFGGLGALGGGGGGLAGLGGGLLPGAVSSVGAGNAAGLLGYCVKRRLLGGANAQSAQSVLGRLTGQPAVAKSSDYQAGQNGQVVTPSGSFSLDGVKDKVKGKVCDLVLSHAQSFVGR